jgi:hypothetical protein
MSQREKQGDTWYSHKAIGEQGEVLYCRGYPGKSSPGYQVPAKRAGVDEAQRQRPQAQPQQTRGQEQRPSGPPPDDGVDATRMMLPDYRDMAEKAKTLTEFDYAAYMALRNGVYDSVERVTKTRNSLICDWRPAPTANTAMLLALEVYRDKRAAAEADGEKLKAAHQTAKQEALEAYKALLEE